jgi:hypothetical protein
MWFSVYFHINIKWIGTAPPTNQNHPARHMHRFAEEREAIQEFRCYNQSDVECVTRQTELAHSGPNRTTTIRRVGQAEALQIRERIDSQSEKLKALTTTQCGKCRGNKWITFVQSEVRS